MTNHTPKAFLRGRNNTRRPVNTYLNLLNAKLLELALKERAAWGKIIKANGLKDSKGRTLANPITKFTQLHPTKGYRTEHF